MKTYSNKTDRIDERKNLFSQIKHGNRARKKAVRQESKKLIQKELTQE